MGLFNNKRFGGLMDEIRCDEPNYLVWKWRPSGSNPRESNRENSIRWGSSLRVKDGEVAVFVYKQKNGTTQDFIVGPYDKFIETKNFPVLASIIGLAYDGGTPFQAEVYFINLAQIVQVKFGVPYFDIYDPRFLDFGVPVAVRGTINFSIKDYKEFVKLHRLIDFNLDDFQTQIRDAVSRYVKDVVANAPAQNNIPLVQIETKTAMINDAVEYNLSQRLAENFGINVSGIDIGAIEIDKTSDGYRELMSVTKEVTTTTVKAETVAKVKDIEDKQRIESMNYEETLRIQREESQYALHKQTQTANINAFTIEKQAEVGIAGADALGKMGSNGAGDINLSGNDSGLNMASLMASMAVGGVVGQNIAGAMNGMMQFNNTLNSLPPLPSSSYFIVLNGKAEGPFTLEILKQKMLNDQFNSSTYVWKQGMDNWILASEIDELKELFRVAMPPIPNDK